MTRTAKSLRREFVISSIFMVLIVLLSGAMGIYTVSDKSLQVAFKFTRTALALDSQYPGSLDWDRMFDQAVQGMMADLDRYSGYVDIHQFEQIDEERTGAYSGIGVSVVGDDRGLLIMSVREGGPAAERGVLSGDIILKADSIHLNTVPIVRASDYLRGPDGTEVKLSVLRPVSGDTTEIDITRRKLELLHIPFAGYTPDSMVYIRLLDFDAGASESVEAAIDSLITKRPKRSLGIILDLRGNPGGQLYEAYKTADLFLEDGKLIVGTQGRSRWNSEQYEATDDDKTDGLPMAVLVDQGSASASEIVAGALKQNNRAILVGDTTFGKGLVQGFNRFDDGSGLRLTTSRYYLEGNLFLNEFDSTLIDTGRGLVPNYPIHFVERDHYPRWLEQSLLLHEFAASHEDEILGISQGFSLGDEWVQRFNAFLGEEKAFYRSLQSEQAQLMADLAIFEGQSAKVRRAITELANISLAHDSLSAKYYGNYITMRLAQLAWERKFGTSRAYSEVTIRQKPEIAYASQLLRERKR
ncbi:MAG: S41 family peptidase [candidate division Zixibacteria bacterium]|nr:S41 family peptidase [candidate division Zixibacteria bacterium]